MSHERLIYINSEQHGTGAPGEARMLLPSAQFSVIGDDTLKLTLLQFEMRRSWKNINATNNVFYLQYAAVSGTATTFEPVAIPIGNYTSYDSVAKTDTLSSAIKSGIDDAIQRAKANNSLSLSGKTFTCAAVSHNDVKRTFEIDFDHDLHSLDINFFMLKPSVAAPVGVSITNTDAHEILGGIPTTDQLVSGLDSSTVTIAGTSYKRFESFGLPTAMNTVKALYLRANFQTSNYATTNFDLNASGSSSLTESTILARIPLYRASFDDAFEVIQFEDQNDTFGVHLRQKNLDQMILTVTDDKGRPICETYSDTSLHKHINFKAVLRVDYIHEAYSQPKRSSHHQGAEVSIAKSLMEKKYF